MKILISLILLNILSPWAWSQVALPPDAQSVDAARTRIASQRQQATQKFDKEDQACLVRFAVTACQNDAATRRRTVLTDLRRQELVLNDAMRKEAEHARVERLKVKAAENAASPAAHVSASRDIAITPQHGASENVRNPQQPRASQTTPRPTNKVIDPVDPAVLAERRRAYAAKQEELVRRRQERDKRLQTPSKSGLPTPP